MNRTIKINFCDFSEDFNENDNIFVNSLRKKYKVEISDHPDFLFYSVFGRNNNEFKNCVRIFFTGENVTPDFNSCDYGIGFDYIQFEDRYLRFGYHLDDPSIIEERANLDDGVLQRKFCNFVYANSDSGRGASARREFCSLLADYKRVDCPGRVLNNMKNAIVPRHGDWNQGKLDFLKDYKFTIAFENSSSIGYTTEKLIHPFLAHSVPIYWGNPEVYREFRQGSFVNCHDFKNFNEVVEYIKYLDQNNTAYLEMLRCSPVHGDYGFDRLEKLDNFLFSLVEKGNMPIEKDPRVWDPNARMILLLQDQLSEVNIRKTYGAVIAFFLSRKARQKAKKVLKNFRRLFRRRSFGRGQIIP